MAPQVEQVGVEVPGAERADDRAVGLGRKGRAGALTFSRDLLPIDLAVRDWARRDKAVARRLRRVDNRRIAYLRSLIGTFCPDPDEVEGRSMLAFSLAIGNHFIAAEHGARGRAQVLDLAIERVLA